MIYASVLTQDGSLSCIDPETGELCHNRAGAYTEAIQQYVRPSGLSARLAHQAEIRIFDACYGLGYNTWALINTLNAEALSFNATDHERYISIISVEKALEILQFLPEILEQPSLRHLKSKMQALEHNTYYRTLEALNLETDQPQNVLNLDLELTPKCHLHWELWLGDLRTFAPLLTGDFDAIFHDPFSPQKMPELWTVDLFRQYHARLCVKNGKLLTYSAAAAVRGGLIEAGFALRKSHALGNKAGGGTIAQPFPPIEMNCLEIKSTEAKLIKIESDAFETGLPLDDWELSYLETRAGLPYRDVNLCATRPMILSTREDEQQHSARPSGSTVLKTKPRPGS